MAPEVEENERLLSEWQKCRIKIATNLTKILLNGAASDEINKRMKLNA